MKRSALARLHEIVPLKAIFVPMAAEKAELQQLRSEHSRPRSSGWRHTSVPRRGSPTFRDRQAAGARRFGRSSEKLERAQQACLRIQTGLGAIESELEAARPQDRQASRDVLRDRARRSRCIWSGSRSSSGSTHGGRSAPAANRPVRQTPSAARACETEQSRPRLDADARCCARTRIPSPVGSPPTSCRRSIAATSSG